MQKKKSDSNKRNIAVIFGIAAAIILATVIWSVIMFAQPTAEEVLEEGTFEEGIFIAGVDVSGKTVDEAEPLIREKADAVLEGLFASYTVNGTQHWLDAYDLGAEVPLESVIREAILYEKTKEEEETGRYISFEIKPTVNIDKIKETLEIQGARYNTEPVNATVTVVTDQSESNLTCSGEVKYTESQQGMTVDAAALAERIVKAVEEGSETMPLAVEPQITDPELSLEQLQQNCTLMASYETEFKTSAFGRCYNIWKMSTVVNGIVLQPGEEWSINEAAGPRTEALGWAIDKGIRNGAYVDDPGGGICQVSTTLYNAVIRSEANVVERKHHSWPSSYVPVGLDATISTGAPDFIFSNPYDYPIAVIVNTDGKNDKTVKVSVYGPEMDYKLDFKSTIVKETQPDPQKTTFDPNLSPGTSVETSPRKIGKIAEIYKHWYDKETGEEIREPELYYTDTYKAFAGTIAYGPSPSPSPSLSPSADPTTSADPTVSADPQASSGTQAPEASAGGEPTKAPETEDKPEATPEPTPAKQPEETGAEE